MKTEEQRAARGFGGNFSSFSSSWAAFEKQEKYLSLNAKISNAAFLKYLFSTVTVQYTSGLGSVPAPT